MPNKLFAVPLDPMLILKRSPVKVVEAVGLQSRENPVKDVEVDIDPRSRSADGFVLPMPTLPLASMVNRSPPPAPFERTCNASAVAPDASSMICPTTAVDPNPICSCAPGLVKPIPPRVPSV